MTKILIVALSLALTLPTAHAAELGSLTTGTEISQHQMDALTIGKTTKQDVSDAFGAPSRREQLGDTQVWYYDFTKIRSFGKNVSESTVLEFDKDGRLSVKSKSNGGGAKKTGNPLLDAASGGS